MPRSLPFWVQIPIALVLLGLIALIATGVGRAFGGGVYVLLLPWHLQRGDARRERALLFGAGGLLLLGATVAFGPWSLPGDGPHELAKGLRSLVGALAVATVSRFWLLGCDSAGRWIAGLRARGVWPTV